MPKLRFPEFSGEWERKKLGDVSEIKGGKRLPKGHSLVEFDTGYPYIRVVDFGKNSVNSHSLQFLLDETQKLIRNYTITSQNIYLSIAGSIGLCGTIPEELNGANLTENAAKIANFKNIDKKFLVYLFECNSMVKQIKASTTKATQPKLALVRIKKFDVDLPSFQEQEKIVSFLSRVDEKIGKLEKKQELWEIYKKGLMQQIFSQKLRFKDKNGEDYPDWEEKKFNQIFNFIPSNSFSRENLNYETGNVYNIHYGDIHTKYPIHLDFENAEVPFINDDVDLKRIKAESYCKDGDLVIVDASEDYEDIGKAIELKNIGNKNVLAGLHTFLARDKLGYTKPGYRCYILLDDSVKLQIKKLATGVSVLGISKSNLGSVRLMVPSLQEQSKIAGFLSAIGSKIKQLNKELEMNKEFKKGLLQQMFC